MRFCNQQTLNTFNIYVNIRLVIIMDNLEKIYRDLKIKMNEVEIDLSEKQRQLSQLSVEKQSIIIKKIHGELYYYAQWRENGKVKSRFLSPVGPGVIAEEEGLQIKAGQLNREIRQLKINLENLKKMVSYLEKQKRKENLMENFSFEVYWKDEITARVYVKAREVIISRFTEHPLKQLFAQRKMTRYQLGKIFELRCPERGRADIDELLRYFGLKEYNPYEIVRRTHGVSYNDYIWFRFPGEKITSKDVLVRRDDI